MSPQAHVAPHANALAPHANTAVRHTQHRLTATSWPGPRHPHVRRASAPYLTPATPVPYHGAW